MKNITIIILGVDAYTYCSRFLYNLDKISVLKIVCILKAFGSTVIGQKML
jgi:hypothetical protein